MSRVKLPSTNSVRWNVDKHSRETSVFSYKYSRSHPVLSTLVSKSDLIGRYIITLAWPWLRSHRCPRVPQLLHCLSSFLSGQSRPPGSNLKVKPIAPFLWQRDPWHDVAVRRSLLMRLHPPSPASGEWALWSQTVAYIILASSKAAPCLTTEPRCHSLQPVAKHATPVFIPTFHPFLPHTFARSDVSISYVTAAIYCVTRSGKVQQLVNHLKLHRSQQTLIHKRSQRSECRLTRVSIKPLYHCWRRCRQWRQQPLTVA